MPIPLPDRGELKVDPVGNRRCNQRATAPSAMLLEALLEVLREADVVPRVPVRAIEVQQVDDSVVGHRQRLQAVGASPGWRGRSPTPGRPPGRENPGGDEARRPPRLLDRVCKAVANSPDIPQQPVGAGVGEPPPQAARMTVERASPAAVRMAPHIAQQLFPREYPRRLAGERAQQLVLLGRKLKPVLLDLHDPCGEVDRQLADPQHRGARAPGRGEAAR